MKKYILSIDQGTTGTTCILVGEDGSWLDSINKEHEQVFVKSGWVEHKPEEIWANTLELIEALLKKYSLKVQQIEAIGITNQRETSVAWDRKTGQSLYNAIVWQCRRTTEFCEQLKEQGLESQIQKATGLVVDPYFSGSKFRWLLKNVSAVEKAFQDDSLAFGTIDSFLIFKMTGGDCHVTDVSNASRTQLMNIDSLQWDEDLLKIFEVPKKTLPSICPSSGILGHTKNMKVLPDGIPIAGVAGDQQAALFGQVAFQSGEGKCTFGTGSFILVNTGEAKVVSQTGLLTTVAWQLPDQKPVYALEGGAFLCGAVVQWLRDGLGIIEKSVEVEALAQSVSSSEGVFLIPSFAGLGAPHWRPEARGLIGGLTRGSSKGHIARAALEAMAWQNVDILNSIAVDLGKDIKDLKVDGGAVVNDLLLQMQSDYLGCRVLRSQVIETTVMGAAYLAGLGCGLWNSTEELSHLWQSDKEFTPQIDESERKASHTKWLQQIQKA